jgi:uncharacterized lipoprotein YbaY
VNTVMQNEAAFLPKEEASTSHSPDGTMVRRKGASMAVVVEILFKSNVEAFSGANLNVRIEDVTSADEAATIVAAIRQENVSYSPATDPPFLFTLQLDSVNPHASYSVRVHIDVDGDGHVSVGDFITTQNYPVLTFGHPDRVAVVVDCVV